MSDPSPIPLPDSPPQSPPPSPPQRKPLGFILLLMVTVFASILLYSRHVPEEWTTPIKGLSALIGAVFAVMGLKMDAKSEASLLGMRPSRTAVISLWVIFIAVGTILIVEQKHKLKITAYPGTKIYVDKNYYFKVLPDFSKDKLEMRDEYIMLKWGTHEIKLTENPLCPGQEEVFREDLSIQDLLIPKSSGDGYKDSEHDRVVISKMRIAPLVAVADSEKVGFDRTVAIVLSRVFSQFWNQVIEQGQESDGIKGIDREANPILHILSSSSNSSSATIDVHLGIIRGNSALKSPRFRHFTYLPRRNDQNTFKAIEDVKWQSEAMDAFWRNLTLEIPDDDLSTWIKQKLENYSQEDKDPAAGTPDATSIANGYGRTALIQAKSGFLEELTLAAKGALAQANADEALAIVQQSTTPTSQDPSMANAAMEQQVQQQAQQVQIQQQQLAQQQVQVQQEQYLQTVGDASNDPLATAIQASVAPPTDNQKAQADIVEKAKTIADKRPVRIYYHIANETQNDRMTEVKDAVKQITVKEATREIKSMGIQNVSGKGYIPDMLEVRYFVHPESKATAEAILKGIRDSNKLKAGAKARISYVIPSDYDRKTSVDLASHIEVWAARDSF